MLPKDTNAKDIPGSGFGKSQLIEFVRRIAGKIIVVVTPAIPPTLLSPQAVWSAAWTPTRLANV